MKEWKKLSKCKPPINTWILTRIKVGNEYIYDTNRWIPYDSCNLFEKYLTEENEDVEWIILDVK